ncbi:MAG: hypothetical protein RLZZ220_2866 [Pseudomonadota bacterium]|jgi:hypothetical protein|uniref:Uncharacterized protein n=1 Tax=Zoogloea ramigera TaxID=350 RepID=A0A4Y4CNZ7_ZOORA|nr:hypothetical protein [Zoogloea ramigera]MBP7627311.1 hypothetical protein [Zoogloea sp.]GEC94588.1 hypothetical protein ZRA01_06610 [Zoogloea ramigera]
MDPFYSDISPDDAIEIEHLARLMYDLRSARDKLLVQLGASDAADVLKRITSGELPEHPSYEHYLSLGILADLHGQVRSELATCVKESRTR